MFKEFRFEVEYKLGKYQILGLDQSGGYLNSEILNHLKENWILSMDCTRTSRMNGVSKRKNRTLLDMVYSMMSRTEIPYGFGDSHSSTRSLF